MLDQDGAVKEMLDGRSHFGHHRRQRHFAMKWGIMRRFLQLWLPGTLAALALLWSFYCAFYLYQVKDRRVWALSDDAYVSACYARNLAGGEGLVWFPGAERVEGFSNPLWVFLMAAMHKLPGFREALLGRRVMLLQSVLLAALFVLFWRCWRRGLRQDDPPPHDPWSVPPPWLNDALLSVLTLGAASLVYWMAEGFEVGLIALLALGAFECAARPRLGMRDACLIGALAGLAGWTRLDGPLYCAGAGVLMLTTAAPWRRRLGLASLAGAVAAALLGAEFLERHAYYGQWLPNTYYLKLEHWPLPDRLRQGLRQNGPLLPAVALAWLPLILPVVRRRLGAVARPIGAALAVFTLAAAYSTHNGGDAWGLKAGYDRFAAIGAIFLILALALLVGRLGWNKAALAVAFLYALIVAALPLALDGGFPRFVQETLHLRKNKKFERTWIVYGMAFEKIAPEGARLALSPAGAIIYFSHRGGIDLLGKCDPWVAHQPVNRPDKPAGHNKDYGEEVIRQRLPEFSREYPPEAVETHYNAYASKAGIYYIRRDAHDINLKGLKPSDTRVRVISHTIPSTLAPGHRVPFEITLLNEGDVAWTEKAGFRLAVTRDPSKLGAGMHGRLRLEGATNVKKGERAVFRGELQAPPTPGVCELDFRMVWELQHYFGPTLRMKVAVTRATAKR